MSAWQYYYRHMPADQQEVYHRLLVGLRELSPAIRIPKCEVDTLSTIFFQLRLDHPEIFWAVSFNCRGYSGAESWEFVPEYMFHKDKVKEHQKALSARLERLCRPARELDEAGQEPAGKPSGAVPLRGDGGRRRPCLPLAMVFASACRSARFSPAGLLASRHKEVVPS